MAELRVLNDDGISRFSGYLEELRAEPRTPPPFEILEDSTLSRRIGRRLDVERKQIGTRLEAARYLHQLLKVLDRADVDHNAGLWTWLSLFFFDELCPADSGGARKPGKTYRYVLPRPGEPEHFRHYYRHLLAGAYTTLRLHPDSARVLLCGAIEKFDDFNEQIASRQELITNRALVETLDTLYFDMAGSKAKRGAASNKRKPGTLRRLIDVVAQVDLTYDLYSMTAPQLLKILPQEFDAWANRSP